MIGDTIVTFYPYSHFDSITQMPVGVPQPLYGYDEKKIYWITMFMNTNQCHPPSSIPADSFYLKTYWSDFPGATNGDTIINYPLSNSLFTIPDAPLYCTHINIPVQNQSNSTFKFDLDLRTDLGTFAPGYIYNENFFRHHLTDNTFLAVEYGNFVVDSVVGLNAWSFAGMGFSTGLVPQLPYGGTAGLYNLGQIGPDWAARKISVFGHYSCANVQQYPNNTDSILVYYGWSCDGFPATDVHDACYWDSLWVEFDVITPGIQPELIPLSSINACDTIEYSVWIHATGSGDISNIEIELPQTSYSYVPGSAYTDYYGTIGSIPELFQGDTVLFEVPDTLNFDSILFNFSVVPNCSFYQSNDEIEIFVSAQNYCGLLMGPIPLFDRPDTIYGLPQHDSLLISIQGDTISGCGDLANITIIVNNVGNQNVSPDDSVSVMLPPGFNWFGGDPYSSQAGQTYSFDLSGGNAPGTSETINFTVSGVSGAGWLDLYAWVYSYQILYCNSDTCYYSMANAVDMDSALITVIPQSNNITVTAANCYGSCDGSATVSSTGMAPFIYNWSTGASGSTIGSLCAGNYWVAVSDVNGCIDTVHFEILQPDSIEIAFNVVNSLCAASCTAQAEALASGGVSPYSYSWSNGSNINTANNLCGGWVSVTVSDSNACSVTDSVLIYDSAPLEFDLTHTDETCAGFCDGTANVNVISGTPGYTYAWSSGQNTSYVTGLCAGIYTVTVNDTNACEGIDTVQIAAAAYGVPKPIFYLDTTCLRASDTLQFYATDPTATTWLWNFGDGTTSTLQNPTHVYSDFGYYCVSLTASNACGDSAISQTIFVQSASCPCDSNYEISNGWIVTGSQTLNNQTFGTQDVRVHGDIVVTSGSHLHISSVNLLMHPQSRIIVERGAHLSLVDCIISDLNDCGMWQGIEVWGSSDSASYSGIHGKVELLGAVFIYNAHIAILSGKRNLSCPCDTTQEPFDLAYSGGIIDASSQAGVNCEFRNNGIDIKYTRKNNPEGSANRLNNMTFACTQLGDLHYSNTNPNPYPNTQNPWAGNANALQRTWRGIEINNLQGVDVKSSVFNKLQYGVHLTNSQVDVDSSTFATLGYGVYCLNDMQTINYKHNIANCLFTDIDDPESNVGSGVYILNGFGDKIAYNSFNSTGAYSEYGVYLDHCIYNKTNENTFSEISIGVYDHYAVNGMVGSDNPEYRGNQFNSCHLGISTKAKNTYLQLKCNDHTPDNNDPFYANNWRNAAVWVPFLSPPFSGWALEGLGSQGSNSTSPKKLAGNRFYIDNFKQIKSNQYYRYYHHDINLSGPTFRPDLATGTWVSRINKGVAYGSDLISCRSRFMIDTIAINISLGNFSTKMDSLNLTAPALWQNYIDAVTALDDGETTTLINAIESGTPNGRLKNMLIAHSPLSDTVIYTLMYEDALSAGNFKNVMEINLPVSDELAPAFMSYCLSLPPGIAMQLLEMQADNSNSESPTAKLRLYDENRMMYGELMTEAITVLLEYDRKDDVIMLLEKDPSVEAKSILVNTYLNDGDLNAAQNELDELEQMSAYREPTLPQFIDQAQALINHALIGNNIYKLDSAVFADIYETAWQCPAQPYIFMARAIVEIVTGEHIPECPEGGRSLIEQYPQHAPEAQSCFIGEGYPVPADRECVVPYVLPHEGSYTMKVSSVNGLLKFEELLQPSCTEIRLNTTDWANGAYVISLYNNGRLLCSKKLIILHD